MVNIPAFIELMGKTLELDAELNKYLGRYNITGNSTNSVTRLDLWIKRIEELVINVKTDRLEQRDVFKVLVNELKTVNKGDEAKATMILLGALLHRYFRIIKEYDWYSFYSSPLDSKLFQSIRATLQLDEHVTYADFKREDMKRLDVMTVVSSLEMFRDYMLFECDNERPRYEKYEHFKSPKNPKFLIQLKEIIDQHFISDKQKESESVVTQFKAILFIQSLARQLQADSLLVDSTLDDWAKSLNKDHPDFSQLTSMTIKNHLSAHIKPEGLRKKSMDLFSLDLIQGKFNKIQEASISDVEEESSQDKELNANLSDHQLLINEMKKAHSATASYTLFGGYVLLLQIKTIPEHLKTYMLKALGDEKASTAINSDDMMSGLDFLKDHLKSNPELVLDWSCFGGKGGFDTQLARVDIALISKMKEENLKQAVAFTI